MDKIVPRNEPCEPFRVKNQSLSVVTIEERTVCGKTWTISNTSASMGRGIDLGGDIPFHARHRRPVCGEGVSGSDLAVNPFPHACSRLEMRNIFAGDFHCFA